MKNRDEENKFLFAEMKRLKEENVPLEKNYARNKLINDNLKLVSFVVNKYFSLNEDLEDLKSIGTFGLINAVDNFDETKEVKFSSYASEAIKNSIHRHFYLADMPKRMIQNYTISMNTPIGEDDGNRKMTIEGTLYDEDSHKFPDIIAQDDENKYLRKQLKYLTIDEQIVLVLRFGLYENKSNTLEEVSLILDKSIERVRQCEKQGIRKLKIIFNNEENAKELKQYFYPTIRDMSDYELCKFAQPTKKQTTKAEVENETQKTEVKLQLLPYTYLFKKSNVKLEDIKQNLIHLTPMEQFALCCTYEIYDQKLAKFDSSIVSKNKFEQNLDSARKKLATLLLRRDKTKTYSYLNPYSELKRQTHQLIASQEDMIKYLGLNRYISK